MRAAKVRHTRTPSGLPGQAWNGAVLAAGGHFLQSREWATLQQSWWREIAWAVGPDWLGWGMLQPTGSPRRWRGHRSEKIWYLPYGPVVSGDPFDALADLLDDAWELGVRTVRFEPTGRASISAQWEWCGARRVPDVQPRRTHVIDLTASEASLWRALSTNHRRSITSGRRLGIRFRESDGGSDLEALVGFLHATAERNRFGLPPDEYFRRMLAVLGPIGAARLYVSDYQDRAVAATLLIGNDTVRHYAHTAASPDARALKVGALHAWSMMMQARDEGAERFDLWGVAEPDAPSSHPWAGLSRFKRSFGGYDVCHAGTWELAVGRHRPGRRRS